MNRQKNRGLIILLILTILVNISFAQECDTLFNFNTWQMKGNPGGSWQILDDNNIINESYIFEPTLFVNRQDLLNVHIKGTISVESGQDVDFIGFVFGYHEPTGIGINNIYNFYLFDWKSKKGTVHNYVAKEGFRLSYYNGKINEGEISPLFWSPYNVPPQRSLIASKYGGDLGWEPYEKYRFELSYTANKILIKIDDEVIFDHNGCFGPGKVGFYCMSQTKTHFENFSVKSFLNFTHEPTTACVNEEVSFLPYYPLCSDLPDFVDSLYWEFGDSKSSTELFPLHNYKTDGTYDIKLTVYKEGECFDAINRQIVIKPNPTVNIGSDTMVDACTTITLEADNPNSEYLWSNGSHQQITDIYMISDTTVYVDVVKNNCLGSDTINIKTKFLPISELKFPNAFSPNGDGLNDKFEAVGITDDVSKFNMQIFNRWGQLIFETYSVYEGWDSFYNGQASPSGIYVFKVNYINGNTCTGLLPYSYNGTFTLIR